MKSWLAATDPRDQHARWPLQGVNRGDLAKTPRSIGRLVQARLGALARRRHRLTAAAVIAGLLVVAGCGDRESRTGTSPPPRPTSGDGRPIGPTRSPAHAEAIAAATRFVRGYLAFQAGQLTPDQIPSATAQLRRGLTRLRVPPASRARRTRIVAARLERIDARSARVTVEVRNLDEQLTYPLPIDLVRQHGRWAVLAAGDDT